MITRKLSEQHLNRVLESINSNTLESVSIAPNKRGVHMISYETESNENTSANKNTSTVELIRLLREIRKQENAKSYNIIKLEYDRKLNKLTYQLDLKKQG